MAENIISAKVANQREAATIVRRAKELGMTCSAFIRETIRSALEDKPRRRAKLRVIEGGKS